MKNIIDRIKGPTPRFFRRIRNAGLLLTALSGAVLSSPVVLPALLVTAAGYLAIAGTIASVISQTAIAEDDAP